MNRSLFTRLAVVLLVVAMPTFVFANSVGKPSAGGSSMSWDIAVSGHDSIVLTVQHDGEIYTKTFKAGKPVVFNLKDMPSDVPVDGPYDYQLSVVPNIPAGLKRQLEAARATGDEKASQKVFKAAGIVVPQPQSGTFTVLNGSIVDPYGTEEGANDAKSSPSVSTTGVGSGTFSGPASRFDPEVNDQVIPDDLIVQGSTCTGFDCVDGESFGFDTLRLKENNLRIHFEDTSTSAGFPANDWRLIANDSTSGGANKFVVEDSTAARNPMTIEAGAPANALYVDSTGNIGLQQSAPGLDLHIATSDTPAIRLEQTNAGGFTAQTWDVAGNEANFFVRDLTGGSRLSFRIRPGAPTSSIDISADGDTGVGTASPQAQLHVVTTDAIDGVWVDGTTNPALRMATGAVPKAAFALPTVNAAWSSDAIANDLVIRTEATTQRILFNVNAGGASALAINNGNVGIGTATPGSDLVIANGAASSSINAGSSTFTVASSRSFKDNIEPVAVDDILTRISSVPVVTYDYKDNGPKDRLGLVAEEFHTVLGRGSDKYIDGQDVQMALWLAVQKLTAENKALTDRLEELESKVVTEPAANQ